MSLLRITALKISKRAFQKKSENTVSYGSARSLALGKDYALNSREPCTIKCLHGVTTSPYHTYTASLLVAAFDQIEGHGGEGRQQTLQARYLNPTMSLGICLQEWNPNS